MPIWGISGACRSVSVGLPALILNYFGQGALLLSDVSAIENPFCLHAPGWLYYPLIGFATVATIIASQAIISAAFSLTQQSNPAGFLASPAGAPYGQSRARADLHADGELASRRRYARCRADVRLVRRTRRRLRHRCLDADGYHHRARGARRPAMGLHPLLVATVNGIFLFVDLIFVAANATKLIEGG